MSVGREKLLGLVVTGSVRAMQMREGNAKEYNKYFRNKKKRQKIKYEESKLGRNEV